MDNSTFHELLSGAFNSHHEGFPDGLHIANGVIEALQIVLQYTLIIELTEKVRKKRIEPRKSFQTRNWTENLGFWKKLTRFKFFPGIGFLHAEKGRTTNRDVFVLIQLIPVDRLHLRDTKSQGQFNRWGIIYTYTKNWFVCVNEPFPKDYLLFRGRILRISPLGHYPTGDATADSILQVNNEHVAALYTLCKWT